MTLLSESEGTVATEQQKEFDKEGFPAELCQAFQTVANDLKMIVMSRVPGGNCRQLIEESYDLKGFFIKAKSCDWGPMAGFLCQLPVFNKKGSDLRSSNAKANYKTFVGYNKIQTFIDAKKKGKNLTTKEVNGAANCMPTDAEEQLLATGEFPTTYGALKDPAWENSKSPFTHLKISDARKQDMVKNPSGYFLTVKRSNDDVVYGLSWNEKRNVFMEFMLLKESKGWAVYHGDVWYQPKGEGAEPPYKEWTDFLGAQDKDLDAFHYYQPRDAAPPTVRGKLEKILMKLKDETNNVAYVPRQLVVPPINTVAPPAAAPATQADPLAGLPINKFPDGTRAFYPILGIKNNYPPYRSDGSPNRIGDGADSDYYKNAVTGDYDLFAVWPDKNTNAASVRAISRASEKGSKRFAIGHNGMYVEVIPSFVELENKDGGMNEDPRMGNYCNNVAEVAQRLNSLMTKYGVASTNKAFHSDEGGRPGIDTLDLPTAVFAPTQAGGEKTYRRYMMKKKNEFLTIALECKNQYTILIHAGWLQDLLQDMSAPATTPEYKKNFTDLFGQLASDANLVEAAKVIKLNVQGNRTSDPSKGAPVAISTPQAVENIREALKIFAAPVNLNKPVRPQ